MSDSALQSAALGLVVPCYNEAFRLDRSTFQSFLSRPAGPFVLFVDDGSTDDTALVLDTLARDAAPGRAAVLRMPANAGKAEAVRHGLLALLDRKDLAFVGFWDADLATPLYEIDNFLGVFKRNPDVEWVLGARVQLLGRNIRRRAIRHYLGRVFATAVSVSLSLPVYDTQCGAKMFRVSERFASLVREPFVSRWIFDVEMIARLLATGAPRERRAHGIYELPLQQWVDVDGSKVRPRDFFRAFFDLLRIRRSVG